MTRGAGAPWAEAVVYELHVGAFTPAGTFSGVAERVLDHLVELGVTAIELMPVADFPGRRNWGYDGVLPFAPDSTYGRPDDLKALVDARASPRRRGRPRRRLQPFRSGRQLPGVVRAAVLHRPPQDAVGRRDQLRRRRQCDRARVLRSRTRCYWLEEYHLDGLRLDAVHAIVDDGPVHIAHANWPSACARRFTGRPIHLILENEENEARRLLRDRWPAALVHGAVERRRAPRAARGASPARRAATTPIIAATRRSLARALAEGFAFQGETMAYRGRPRGEPSAAPAARRLRGLHPEPRSDRQPRVRGAAGGARAAGGGARCGGRLSAVAGDSDAVHGRGVGRPSSRFRSSATSRASWPRQSGADGERSSRAFPPLPIRRRASKFPIPKPRPPSRRRSSTGRRRRARRTPRRWPGTGVSSRPAVPNSCR